MLNDVFACCMAGVPDGTVVRIPNSSIALWVGSAHAVGRTSRHCHSRSLAGTYARAEVDAAKQSRGEECESSARDSVGGNAGCLARISATTIWRKLVRAVAGLPTVVLSGPRIKRVGFSGHRQLRGRCPRGVRWRRWWWAGALPVRACCSGPLLPRPPASLQSTSGTSFT